MDFSLYITKTNSYLEKMFIEKGYTDFEFYNWSKRNIKDGWLIYDIGANIFEYTEIFARLSGPNSTVYSFEPQHQLFDNYLTAKKSNDYTNAAKIIAFNFALGDNQESKELRIPKFNLGGASISEGFKQYQDDLGLTETITETIQVKRADSLDLPKQIPNLIKIDIEGYELQAWQGFTEAMKQAKIIIAEVGPYTEIELLEEYFKNRKAYDLQDNPMLAQNPESMVKFLYKNKHRQYNVVFR